MKSIYYMGLTDLAVSLRSYFDWKFFGVVNDEMHQQDIKNYGRGCSLMHLQQYRGREYPSNFITQEDMDKMREEVLSYRPRPSLADRVYTFFRKGN